MGQRSCTAWAGWTGEHNFLHKHRAFPTCQRKGRLLRFELNSILSTVTSNGGAQKLENDVWYDSELIATKVCS